MMPIGYARSRSTIVVFWPPASRAPNPPQLDQKTSEEMNPITPTTTRMMPATWRSIPDTSALTAQAAAAMFAIMSKLGIYVILRLWTLVFGPEAGPLAGFGGNGLLVIGILTIVFGTVGILASQTLPRLAGCSVLISSGTLIAAIGLGDGAVIGAMLFYLVSSTLGIAALFLLVELVERIRDPGADVLAVTMEAYGEGDDEGLADEIGIAIPATIATLGGSFIACALLLAGLPPFSGFIGKFALMAAMLKTDGTAVQASTWTMVGLLTVSGLATLIAMTRTGISSFWARLDDSIPRVRVIEMAPVVCLLLLCLGLTSAAGRRCATWRRRQRPFRRHRTTSRAC